MKVLVLGSSSGCRAASYPATGNSLRTQGSLALSADGQSWLLLNASPDIAQQIRANPVLQARPGMDGTPVKAVLLMDSQIEHVAGLLSLRDGAPLELHATPCVFEDLSSGLPLLQALQHYCGVRWHMVPIAGDTRVAGFHVAGFESLCFTAIALHGPAPAYATQREDGTVGAHIALYVEDSVSGQSLFYSPGPAHIGDSELVWLQEADCLLLDATLEAGEAGTGPHAGCDGTIPATMMQLLQGLSSRKVLAHLCPGHERPDATGLTGEQCRRLGIELAHDGMEIEL